MVESNRDKLVKVSVIGEISSPVSGELPYRITPDGKPEVLPGVGGITYNMRIGDLATGWQADHVEPGVSIKNKEKGDAANRSLNLLACIGNEAVVVSGDAKGSRGVVTGKHGGIEHVLVDFPPDVLEKLVIGDRVQIKAIGVGLKFNDFPDVKVMNLDPCLLDKVVQGAEAGKIAVHVTHVVPASIMGSGLGSQHAYRGDYDIQLFDEETVKQYHLEDLRLGDIIAIEDADNSFGRVYKRGAISVGIIVHSDCVISGHGPGVTTLLSSPDGKIEPRMDPGANLKTYLM